jgi:AbrB family looped-hinge helix DNA binding protein
MGTATLTAKGRVTIPSDVRRRMRLNAGDRIEFVELEGGGYAIKPAGDDVRTLKGLLRKPSKPVSVQDINEAIRRRGAGR